MIKQSRRIVLAGIWAVSILCSSAQTVWTQRHPMHFSDLLSVAWTGSQFVAVDDSSNFLTSRDGTAWTEQNWKSGVPVKFMIWAGTQFVAVGDGTILTSTDGIAWTERMHEGSCFLSSVTWTGSQLVAIGTLPSPGNQSSAGTTIGVVFTSPDGVTWKKTTLPTGSPASVAWSGSRFVLVNNIPYAEWHSVFTSLDAFTWTESSPASAYNLRSVIWADSQWVAVGGSGFISTSPNGDTWTARNSGTEQTLRSVIEMGGKLVAIGDSGTILTSTDGITWNPRESGTTDSLLSVVGSGSQMVAVGAFGTILTSANGIDWKTVRTFWPSDQSTPNLLSVAWTGHELISVGRSDTFLGSTDGIVWTAGSSGAGADLESVVWTGKQLMAIGDHGVILTSQNGIIWKPANSGKDADLLSATWTGTQYVVVGFDSTILTSVNGTDWRPQKSEASILNSVIWTGNRLVAAGEIYNTSVSASSGAIITSQDGVTWTTRNLGAAPSMRSLAFSSTQLVAVGLSGSIFSSPDGTTWTKRNSGQPVCHLISVTWTGKQFIAIGPLETGGSSAAFASSDGINWTQRNSAAIEGELTSMTWTGNQLVAVGANGIVYTSPEDVPGAIARNPHQRNDLSLRFVSSRLLATFPSALLGQGIHSTIYNTAGEKVLEFDSPGLSGEISIPLGGMAPGVYFFEARGRKAKALQQFSLMK